MKQLKDLCSSIFLTVQPVSRHATDMLQTCRRYHVRLMLLTMLHNAFHICCCSDSQLLLSSNKTNQIKLRCGSTLITERDWATPRNSPPFIRNVIDTIELNIRTICENMTDKDINNYLELQRLNCCVLSITFMGYNTYINLIISDSKRTTMSLLNKYILFV